VQSFGPEVLEPDDLRQEIAADLLNMIGTYTEGADMKRKVSLLESNPFLRDKAAREAAIRRTVETSTAIEGVGINFSTTPPPRKSASRKSKNAGQ